MFRIYMFTYLKACTTLEIFQKLACYQKSSWRVEFLKATIKFKTHIRKEAWRHTRQMRHAKTHQQTWDVYFNTSMTSVCNLQPKMFCKKRKQMVLPKLSVHSLPCRNLFWYESTSCMIPNRWTSSCDKISTWWALNLYYAWIENRKICNSLKEKSGDLTYNFVQLCIIIG